MARIVYSALVDKISGSIGGTTFQANQYGFTVKAKPNMIIPKSSTQNRTKNILSRVTRSWRDLSSAQRAAYDTFASSYPQYAKNNPTAELSGYTVFVKYNCLRVLIGSSVLETITGIPPETDTLTYDIDVTAGSLSIEINSTNESEEWRIIFFMSRPFGQAQNFIGTKPRYVDHDVNFTAEVYITSVYEGIFGKIPSVGDIVAMDTILISDDCPYVLAREGAIYTVKTTP